MSNQLPLNPARSDDPHYRYKRPSVTIRYSNSNHTHISNADALCKAIFRGKKILFHFFSLNFATQVNTKKDWIKGFQSSQLVESAIDQFVISYVLCSACGNPETEIKIKSSKNVVYLKCKACGSRTYLSNTDKICEKILKMGKKALKNL